MKDWLIPLVILAVTSLQTLAVWMYRRSLERTREEERGRAQLEGAPSVAARLNDLDRELDALRKAVQELDQSMDRLHKAASDHGDKVQVRLASMESDWRFKFQRIEDKDLRELDARIRHIEEGQTEWVRTLRRRTHRMATYLSKIYARTMLVERGVKPDQPLEPFDSHGDDDDIDR